MCSSDTYEIGREFGEEESEEGEIIEESEEDIPLGNDNANHVENLNDDVTANEENGVENLNDHVNANNAEANEDKGEENTNDQVNATAKSHQDGGNNDITVDFTPEVGDRLNVPGTFDQEQEATVPITDQEHQKKTRGFEEHSGEVGEHSSCDSSVGSESHTIDLNNEPKKTGKFGDEGNKKIRLQSSKVKSKSLPRSLKPKVVMWANRQKFQKKRDKAQNSQSSQDISESSNSVTAEIFKTMNIGNDVGFQMQGFDEMLRSEIQGEGVNRFQK
ncbi:hypothetical protein L2E82_49351 [Cichorium intybus]|uniref:Uncharacterized protein n=1 Tax=Cichorium intybus TaxID=13427 RepID=A0ACB8Z0N3_CICIN|nr:hypothetical protein L2E82_49351 [Cichorium intybus]